MTTRSRSFVRQPALLLAMLGFFFLLQGCCDPRIVTESVPDGCVGQFYIFALEGACADNRWVVTSGDLPPGVALSNVGVLSGRPTLMGTYLFTVTLSDDFHPVSKGFSMMIHDADAPECVEGMDGGVDFP